MRATAASQIYGHLPQDESDRPVGRSVGSLLTRPTRRKPPKHPKPPKPTKPAKPSKPSKPSKPDFEISGFLVQRRVPETS